MVRAVCIDSSNKPVEVPSSHWVVQDQIYHITYIYWMVSQNFKGCDLKEIDLSDHKPYNCFRLDRFAIFQEDLQLFIEMLQTCTQMNSIDIQQLVDSIELVPQE